MRAKMVLCSIIVLALLSSINAIMVSPGNNITEVTEGNCGGQFEYFLCNCTALNATIFVFHLDGTI